MNDTVHTLEEFGNFPWNKMDDDWYRSFGSYASGGVICGVDFNKPKIRHTISFFRTDMSIDVWEIPEQLRRLIDSAYDDGADDLAMKLRGLIGAATVHGRQE